MDDINTTASVDTPVEPFVFARLFEAPLQLVWRAWTESERLAEWWLPQGYTLCSSSMDLRPDGYFCYGMRSPQGQELWGGFDYHTILVPERLVFVASLAEMVRNARPHHAAANGSLKVLNEVAFDYREGTTQLTLRCLPVGCGCLEEAVLSFESGRDTLQESISRSWNRMAAYLDDQLEIAWAGAAVTWR